MIEGIEAKVLNAEPTMTIKDSKSWMTFLSRFPGVLRLAKESRGGKVTLLLCWLPTKKKRRLFTVRPVFGNTATCLVTMMEFAKPLSMVQWKTGSRGLQNF